MPIGRNCSLGVPPYDRVVPELLLSSGVRADAVAWAACKLLLPHRRPPVCQERIVAGFLRRYGMENHVVPRYAVARVHSASEAELLALLDVLQVSSPSYRIVCVEAFEFHRRPERQSTPVEYTATIYGCGSPNYFTSAFAGHHATYLSTLLQHTAWLTVDALSVMGLRFAIRQNDKSVFSLRVADSGSIVVGTHTTLVNFSISGNLYALLLLIDIGLAFVHAVSAVHVLRLLLLPRLLGHHSSSPSTSSHTIAIGFAASSSSSSSGNKSYFSMFSRSMYRCRAVAVLTVVSHVISWQIILANAVIWTWSVSSRGKIQAYMSTCRVWVLLLLAFNTLWDIVVLLRERWAYAFARRTYITTMELMAVGAVVALVERDAIFSMGEKKYALEHQRLTDVAAFHDAIAFANVYNDELDAALLPSVQVLRVVYAPLLRMLALNIASLFAVLVFRLAYLSVRQHRRSIDASMPSTRYERLPIERLLCDALRAKSLIRNDLVLEFVQQQRWYVPATILFDFGVLVDASGGIETRVGFGGVVRPSLELDEIHRRRRASAPAESSVGDCTERGRREKERDGEREGEGGGDT
ncbi:hypothetical protein PINS_up015449 [Pythium insidiosum]|nr:hypothetical protein PINS_up015449 [Pythium insidiosum]